MPSGSSPQLPPRALEPTRNDACLPVDAGTCQIFNNRFLWDENQNPTHPSYAGPCHADYQGSKLNVANGAP